MDVKSWPCFLLFTWCSVFDTSAAENVSMEDGHHIDNFQEVLRSYRHIGRAFNSLLAHGISETSTAIKNSKLFISEHSLPLPNISQPCMDKVFAVMGEIDPTHLPPKEWVLRLLDAQAKPPSGILEGNIAWFGGFHECMNLTVYQNNSNPTPATLVMEGQYCLVTVGLQEDSNHPKVPLLGIPKALRAGLCVPSNCSSYDVEQMVLFGLALLEAKFRALVPENVTVTDVHCPAKKIPLDTGAIVVVTILIIFVTVVVVGSLYDILTNGITSDPEPVAVTVSTVYTSSYTSLLPSDTITAAEQEVEVKSARSIFGQMFMAVSVLPHCRRIFWATWSAHELRWIHGMRVLSMMWIIFGQTYALGLPMYDNLLMLPDAMKGLFAQVIIQATFAVDTFLFLSGYLVTHRFLNDLTVSGFDCWILLRLYVSRYFRLFPVYMIVLGVYATLTKYISSGPLWPQDEAMLGNCSHLAWSNAFYINNYVRPEQMCMPWTWYIAIDFQLFILAPLLILCLFAFWKIGLIICLACIWAVTISAAVISKVKGLPPSLVGFGSTDISAFDQDLILRYFIEYFITTYCRAAPYIFGIAVAHHLRNPAEATQLSRLARVVGWIVAILGLSIVVFGLVPGFNGYPLSVDAAAAFNSLSHIIWASALAWIAYNCMTGCGGLVERFLAWRFWIPLSTISYSTYLFSPIMICIYYLGREEPLRFSHYNAINLFFGNLMFSLFAGFVLYLFIEAPVRNLAKMLFSRTVVRSTVVTFPS